MDDASGGVTLGEALASAGSALRAAGVTTPKLDARLLAAHVFDIAATDMIARPDMPLAAAAAELYRAAVRRRAGGEPVHRIIGAREFYGLSFRLSPATLEPRPDTEALVELAIAHARETVAARGRCRLLDLGTGTGCIAVSILANVPSASALAVDISAQALETAAANAELNGVSDRISFTASNWFDAVEGCFDLIVSNPPYIASKEIAMLDRDVMEHDPLAALDGGADGLDAYRSIAEGSGPHLAPDGVIAVEIGIGQGASVLELFSRTGYRLIESADDLAGVERALVFRGGTRD